MRVAVFGAGYAGLTLARELESSLPEAVDLVVVDEDASHLVQHELHRVVRRPDLADEIVVDLDDVLDRATVREATVTDIDTEAGVATLDKSGDGEDGGDGGDGTAELSYDVGAVCLGAETEYYDLDGVEAHSTPLKRLADAEAVRADFLDAVDAGTAADPARVVVGGAGLSGVQVAGELAALARDEGARDAVEVVLLEQADSVAPNFPENFQRAVREELEARDVRVETGRAVASADDETIAFADGATERYDGFVWTGGIRGPDALRGERPVVRGDLRYEDGTFVVGDAGRIVDTDGEAVPASAQAAIREAGVAADNVERLVDHELSGEGGFEPRLDGYRFDSLGWLVSIGDGAVAQVGPTVLRGRSAKALKTTVGAGYLSSVGAVENAADLVREEVGWPEDEAGEPISDPPGEDDSGRIEK
ncbi:NAD(P)/FAD-dependent oxidoreductase [Halosimplex pelagicum]|uniref:FAD-dependent oxidoreductase n=1 Tax=Halosimplex pelagicum TaxID=869886 RepID=A0A7D5PC28_9EURY|nr:FAD-dependent oxidoreductase [Halosimplex pelagicum]QLH82885.1 FAD-dependent oxidoreductase [Halosimplex pelagicum]